jgi:D(-)-tartrate dehydratase
MRIIRINDDVVPIKSSISNAFISFSEMTVSAIAIHTDMIRDGTPVVGYGFHSNGRYAQAGILHERIFPRLRDADPKALLNDAGDNLDPEKCWRVMMTNEKPGGHGDRSVAVGATDMALWDATAKIEGKPLYRLLAERYHGGISEDRVFVYAAGGYYYPGKDVAALCEEMRSYLDLGYTTVKIKIGGASLAEDLRRIEAVLKLLPEGGRLCVDANGRFDLQTALEYARALAPYGLKWYEEPGDPLDFELLREVAAASETPIATGENLFSMEEARNLIRYGGLDRERDFLQMDPALSYGIVEYLRTLRMLESEEWSARRSIPHGGHQMALHVAAGLGLGGNESYPGVFLPFGGFADETPVEDGMVGLPDAPGIGVERNADLYEVFRRL